MRRLRSARPWPNSRAKKSMFSQTAEVGIEVLAQPLRHVGDARADRPRDSARRPMSPPSTSTPPVLDAAGAGDEASSVDLPTPSGPISPTMQPAGMCERHVVERDRSPVALRRPREARRDRPRRGALIWRRVDLQRRPAMPPSDRSRHRRCPGRPLRTASAACARKQLGIDRAPDAEHQLVALVLRSPPPSA